MASIIINCFINGQQPLCEDQLADCVSSNPVDIERSLDALEAIGLITRTADDPVRYLPLKSVKDCTLVEIWRSLRDFESDKLGVKSDSEDLKKVRQFQQQLDEIIDRENGFTKVYGPDTVTIQTSNITGGLRCPSLKFIIIQIAQNQEQLWPCWKRMM